LPIFRESASCAWSTAPDARFPLPSGSRPSQHHRAAVPLPGPN